MKLAITLHPVTGPATGLLRGNTDTTLMEFTRAVANVLKVTQKMLPPIKWFDLILRNLPGRGDGVQIVPNWRNNGDFGVVPHWTINMDYEGAISFFKGERFVLGANRSDLINGDIFDRLRNRILENRLTFARNVI